jgi:hypothetical protein
MKYMIDNFDKIGTSERYSEYDFPYATLYAVERIGVASGQKYFGTNDWYQKGADWLIKVQTKTGKNEGMWFAPKTLCTPLHDTCFGTLFLARGRAAVAVNKLEYAGADGKPGELEPAAARCGEHGAVGGQGRRARPELADRESAGSRVGAARCADHLPQRQSGTGDPRRSEGEAEELCRGRWHAAGQPRLRRCEVHGIVPQARDRAVPRL